MMVHHDSCPLCSSRSFSSYNECVDHLVSGEMFILIRCSDCGFVFTQDHPDGKEIAGYYDSGDYISHNDSAGGFANRIYRIVRNIMLVRKRRIIEKALGTKQGSLLDIGCGTGYFAGTMKRAGWDVKGIEPNERARESGIAAYGFEILTPEQIGQLKDSTFDCITMWHVLEHFDDPFAYAAEIKRLLKPGGLCISALPNSGSYDSAYYGSNWAAFDVPRHLWHFNPESFARFAGLTGFKIIGTKSLPPDVFYISVLSEKNKGSEFAFLKGLLVGSFFAAKAAIKKERSSSLLFLMKSASD